MKATNDLAIIYCEREEYSSSYALLKQGEKVYEEIGEKSIPLSSIWDSWEILKPGNERNTADGRKDAFEEVYTHTLFYLSQTCQNLGKVGESSDYCGRCLHRQLRTISSKGRRSNPRLRAEIKLRRYHELTSFTYLMLSIDCTYFRGSAVKERLPCSEG